jgi:hypothetical protein
MSTPAYSTETQPGATKMTPAKLANAVAAAKGPRPIKRPAAKAAPAVTPVNTDAFKVGSYSLTSGNAVLTDPRLPGVEIMLVLLTPELAERYLTRLPKRQRKQSERTIDRYAGDMASEQWLFIGDAIKFNGDEELIDGQHRCRAVIESGRPQMTQVVVGLEAEAIVVFDTGRPRRFTDWLTMEGVANASAVASVTKRVFDWQRGNYAVPNIGRVPNALNIGVPASPGKLAETFNGMRTQIQGAARRGMALKANFAPKTASPSVLSFCWLLFGAYDLDRREMFFHELEYGPSQNGADYPMFVLRERMKKYLSASQPGYPDWVWLHFMFTTWNKMLAAESMSSYSLKAPSRAVYSHVELPVDPHAANRPEGWEPLRGDAE